MATPGCSRAFVVSLQSHGSFGFLLCVGLLLELLDPEEMIVSTPARSVRVEGIGMEYEPALVRLATAMDNQTRLSLEPLGAFGAVPSPQSRQILRRFCFLVLLQVSRREEVCPDLIEVPGARGS